MNVMAFAHYMTKRTLILCGGSYNRPYAQMLKCALQDAHRLNKRGILVERAKEVVAIDARIEREKSVVRSIVSSAIDMGYAVSLYDGEEWAIKQSRSKDALMAGIMSTDCDTLQFRKMFGDVKPVGSVFLVYGNSASEVMADWSDNEEVNAILKNAIAQCDRYSAKGW